MQGCNVLRLAYSAAVLEYELPRWSLKQISHSCMCPRKTLLCVLNCQ